MPYFRDVVVGWTLASVSSRSHPLFLRSVILAQREQCMDKRLSPWQSGGVAEWRSARLDWIRKPGDFRSG